MFQFHTTTLVGSMSSLNAKLTSSGHISQAKITHFELAVKFPNITT